MAGIDLLTQSVVVAEKREATKNIDNAGLYNP
jgi:hypothetical protein